MSETTTQAGLDEGVVGRVSGLRSFPVKSLDAPQLDRVRVLPTGLEHDRGWAVVDDASGAVVTAKHAPALRELSAAVVADASTPELSAPAAGPLAAEQVPETLGRLVGRPARLQAADGAAFTDVAPVHVVSRQSVERAAADEGTTLDDPACSIEQPRANLVLDLAGDELETAWVGRELQVGDVVLRISKQPKHCLGVYADVVRPGTLEVGADVRLR